MSIAPVYDYQREVPLMQYEWKVQAALERCGNRIQTISAEEKELDRRLTELQEFWGRRRKFFVAELDKLKVNLERAEAALEESLHPKIVTPPPGPKSLYWLDTDTFNYTCSTVIVSNIIAIFLEAWYPPLLKVLCILEHFYLVFYTVEMVLKCILYQWEFVMGSISVVWWNWFDLAIVAAGISEQWLIPLLFLGQETQKKSLHSSAFRGLRLLRVLRVMRCLKVVNVFLTTDLSWTESTRFQTLISCVIALNALVMGLELDYSWEGWFWAEQAMLLIYAFEMAVSLKRWGLQFFVNTEWAWNNLDFAIVFSGIMEQWLLPVVTRVESLFEIVGLEGTPRHSSLLTLMRMLRLLRILRLLKFLKTCRPLYKLTMGVLEAMQSMQWVLVFTVIILYASAILFRSLVGCGILSTPHAGQIIFTSVSESMFYLFRLMNGLTPIDPLISTAPLRLLYIGFFVVSNWAVLAILTAVVSDNMIVVTRGEQWAEDNLTAEIVQANTRERLKHVFTELDKSGNGTLNACEFYALMKDKKICQELCDAYRIKEVDIQNLFVFLSQKDTDGLWKIDYNEFIEKLACEGRDVSERSVFRVEKTLKLLERQIDKQLDVVWEDVAKSPRKVRQQTKVSRRRVRGSQSKRKLPSPASALVPRRSLSI